METLEGPSSSLLSSSNSKSLNACTSKYQTCHAFGEMERTGKIGGSAYDAHRLPKRLISIGTSGKEPCQDQIRDLSVNKLALPWKGKSSIAQHGFSPQIDCLQAPNNHANPFSTVHLSLGPGPLHAIPTGHRRESIVLPLTCLDSGKIIFDSRSGVEYENTGVPANPLAKWLNNSNHDIGSSIEKSLTPARNNIDSEAATDISVALCPVKNHKRVENFILPMVGYVMSKTEDESTSLSNNGQNRIRDKSHAATKQELAEDVNNVDRPHSEAIIPFREASDRSVSDRIRRTKITEGIKALQSCVSCSNKGNRESGLDDVIDYIKYLKLQLKVLSQSRLCGEATTHPFVHLEGYGHYLFGHPMCNEPLEEVMGQLMEINKQAANELLESKGLAVLPMDLAYTLLQIS